MTGGARPDDRVPMVVVLHPMGGDPAALVSTFEKFPGRARMVFPYGHPRGGLYLWWDVPGDDVSAEVVNAEVDALAAALQAHVAARPTVGKPIVIGFSQGGMLAFALAVRRPEVIAAALPLSGTLPLALFPSMQKSAASLPPIIAFHGQADLAVPIQGARRSIAELQRAGFQASLQEVPGLDHALSDAEVNEVFGRVDALLQGPR